MVIVVVNGLRPTTWKGYASFLEELKWIFIVFSHLMEVAFVVI